MASLSDQIDRLSRNTRAIGATTAYPAALSGPFTRAVLSIPLGDLIRDVDPSELGLFSLPESEITRAEFTGATPLKGAQSRRDDVPKPKDINPEVYAHAALKCIDRYNAVKPMPRAQAQVTAILDRLSLVHENIQRLTETLQQVQAGEGPPLKSLIHEEEERIRNLQTRLRALQERKKSATASKYTSRRTIPVVPPPNSKPQTLPSPSSPQEHSFWNTPAATAKTLRFTDNILDITDSLLNEQVDLGDTSAISSSSPGPASWTAKESLLLSQPDNLSDPNLNLSSKEDTDAQKEHMVNVYDYNVEKGGDGKTVVSIKPAAVPIIPPLTSSAQNSALVTPPNTLGLKRLKWEVNSEVEHIVARIWTTIGDMIMPGHLFDASQVGTGSKPPLSKEIIAHLQSLSDMSPLLTSPSVSSISSTAAGTSATPTSQQVLTAHLLISLLSRPPEFSLPLNKVKNLLANKASSGGGVGATGTTRILYGCVAKRLLKIDRSGGEQVVKFDVQYVEGYS